MHNFIVLASEEPNGIILPADINEVIWSSLAFFIVMGLLIWKGGPAIKGMWNGRVDRIAAELESAEVARTQAEADLGELQARVADAPQERARLTAEAGHNAAAVKEQIAARAEADVVELRNRSLTDVESSKSQATADLQAEIGVLALGAAEAVVAQNLDEATQNELIESYIATVGVRA